MELKIAYSNDLPIGVPAAINWQTGEMLISPGIFHALPDDVQEFVLLHEEGHWRLQTKNEFDANNYAIEKFLHTGSIDDFGRRLMVLIDDVPKISESMAKKPAKQVLSMFDPITISAAIISAGLQFLGLKQKTDAQKDYIEGQKELAKASFEKEKIVFETMRRWQYILVVVVTVSILGFLLFKFNDL